MSTGGVGLVTGANRGLGRETASQLAQRGITILLGSRNLDHGISAARALAECGVHVVPIQLDVTNATSVRTTADRIRGNYGRLDILVNNAGLFIGSLACSTTTAQVRQTFEVNVFGVVAVIRSMLPLLRLSRAPRIVNVSSTTASLTLTSDGSEIPGDADRRLAYASSKAALNMLTVQYARAFSRDPQLSHIKINSAAPGYTATDMNDHRGTRSVAEGARIVVELATLPASGPNGCFFSDQGPVNW
jgi:NAD(P)-dependent dehydrogenase (short-subunit alcohol dehydrogenase family)